MGPGHLEEVVMGGSTGPHGHEDLARTGNGVGDVLDDEGLGRAVASADQCPHQPLRFANDRAMARCWIWEVPSKIRKSRASR